MGKPETLYFKRGEHTFVMVEIDRDYGWLRIGDDMRMNGMDSPASIRLEDVPAFVAWLQTETEQT